MSFPPSGLFRNQRGASRPADAAGTLHSQSPVQNAPLERGLFNLHGYPAFAILNGITKLLQTGDPIITDVMIR